MTSQIHSGADAEAPDSMTGRQHVKTRTLAASATAQAMPIGIKMRSRLMLHWAMIAIDQDRVARKARERLER
jgi:hypothetical protein